MSPGGLIGHLVRQDQSEVPGVRKIVVYELLSLDGVAEDPDSFIADWANATALDGGLAEFARDLKQQRGGDVGVHASISVAQALLAADLVDELRLVIAPKVAGSGRRLLDGLPPIQLESIRSEVSPTGSLLADYRVVR